MRSRRAAAATARWVALAMLMFALGYAVNASSCNTGGGKFRQIGEELGRDVETGRAPSNHKYVGNVHKQLYWPNKQKYVDRIPEGSRVWIYDDEQLAKFKGYKPGPL